MLPLTFTEDNKLMVDSQISIDNVSIGEGLATELKQDSMISLLGLINEGLGGTSAKSIWTVVDSSAANTAKTITKAAVAEKKHYISAFSVIVSGGKPTNDILIELLDGSNVIWREYIGAESPQGDKAGMVFREPIEMSANTAVSLSVAAGGAGVVTTLNLEGWTA